MITRRSVLAAMCLAPLAHAARGAHITASEVAPGIHLLDGAGCNVLAVTGTDTSLLIDGGQAEQSKSLLSAASRATGRRRVGTLINTHWHPAQTGSNERVGREGGEIIAHERSAKTLARAVASADYDGLYGPLPKPGLPTQVVGGDGTIDFSGVRVDYGYLPAAHTDGDLYVHLPDSNLLAAGGPVCSDRWPLLDFRNGGWLGGLVRAHETLAALVRPDTQVVPANGRVMTGAELLRHRDRYQRFHEQLFVFLKKGYGPSDVLAARPLKADEPELGDATAFIKGAYRSLYLAYLPD